MYGKNKARESVELEIKVDESWLMSKRKLNFTFQLLRHWLYQNILCVSY